MGLFKQYETNAKSMVSLWILNESNTELLSIAKEMNLELRLNHYKFEQQHNEYLSSRIALKKINPVFIIDEKKEKSAPQLLNSKTNISISHCKKMSVAMSNYLHPVGIDCEVISPRIHSISSRFMNSSELEFINKYNDDKLLLQYIIWCSKESIFKKYNSLHLDFRENIFIENFKLKSSGELISLVKTHNLMIREKLFYFFFDDVVIVHTT